MVGQLLTPSRRRALEILVGLAFMAFIGRYIYARWLEVQAVPLSFAIPWLIGGGVVLFAFYAVFSLTWQRTLDLIEARPEEATPISLHRAFIMALLARYLPAGNVLTVGGRVELLSRLGGSRSLGLESVYYEQLYLVLGTLALGLTAAPYVPLADLPGWIQPIWWSLWVVVGAGVLVGALTPDLGLRWVVRILRVDRLAHLGSQLNLLNKVELTGRMLAVNILQGASAFVFLRAVYPDLGSELATSLLVMAGYPLSRLVGQLTAFVPGGLGVREGAFAALLGPFLPVQALLLSAVLLRLASVLIELLLAGAMLTAENWEMLAERVAPGGE